MYKPPSECPTCQSTLTLNELSCETCGTTIRGNWSPSPFATLNSDQQAFLILFVRSRGNLSEIERALGVSYPTVRGKLEELIQALAGDETTEVADAQAVELSRREVLERVARGEISASEAVAELSRRKQTED